MNPHRELPFKKGDILDLTHTVDDNWLKGMLDGRKGIFPKSYVKVSVNVCGCGCGCGCAMCVGVDMCVWVCHVCARACGVCVYLACTVNTSSMEFPWFYRC